MGSRSPSRICRGTRRSAGRDLGFLQRGNLWPIMPAHARPADPELRHNMLGMTEAGSVCLVSEDETDQPEHRRGSFGKPAPGFEARVVDPETGRDRAAGEVGELWFRGPFLMAGYYGVERAATFTADGWYRTGDLCRTDADGFFYFSARLGDMIKTAGANVSPREVEAAILDLTGLSAHVLGLPDPDRGQVVAAAVRVPRGHEAPDVDALRASLRGALSAYKVPALIVPIARGRRADDVQRKAGCACIEGPAGGAVGRAGTELTLPALLRRNAKASTATSR